MIRLFSLFKASHILILGSGRALQLFSQIYLALFLRITVDSFYRHAQTILPYTIAILAMYGKIPLD